VFDDIGKGEGSPEFGLDRREMHIATEGPVLIGLRAGVGSKKTGCVYCTRPLVHIAVLRNARDRRIFHIAT